MASDAESFARYVTAQRGRNVNCCARGAIVSGMLGRANFLDDVRGWAFSRPPGPPLDIELHCARGSNSVDVETILALLDGKICAARTVLATVTLTCVPNPLTADSRVARLTTTNEILGKIIENARRFHHCLVSCPAGTVVWSRAGAATWSHRALDLAATDPDAVRALEKLLRAEPPHAFLGRHALEYRETDEREDMGYSYLYDLAEDRLAAAEASVTRLGYLTPVWRGPTSLHEFIRIPFVRHTLVDFCDDTAGELYEELAAYLGLVMTQL